MYSMVEWSMFNGLMVMMMPYDYHLMYIIFPDAYPKCPHRFNGSRFVIPVLGT